RARGSRQRSDARAPVFAAERDDTPRDGPRVEGVGRSAPRARRTAGAGCVLPALDASRAQAAGGAQRAGDPAGRSGPADAGTGELGRFGSKHALVDGSASGRSAWAGAGSSATARSAR